MSSVPGYLHIRPMGLGDILDSAIRLYRYNFGVFLGIVAVAWAPALGLQIYGSYWMFSVLLAEEPPEMSLPWLISTVGVFGVGLALLYLVAVPLAQGALIWAVSKRYLGQSAGVAHSYRIVLRRFGQVIVAIVLTGLVIFAGTLACFLPGLVLTFMFAFTIPEVVLNGCSATEAMRRSWELASYDFWKVVLTLLVLGLLVSIIAGALGAPFGWLALIPAAGDKLALLQSVSGGMRALIQVIVQPVYVVGTILLYYDLRIRKDGFDIKLLAEALEDRAAEGPRKPSGPGASLLSPNGTTMPPKPDSDDER